ncbi:S1C family serine protease [Marinococcus halophilus]|uniref:S1C family serine protease n=1 Tax=Marinococcus halophilus TaxID=1371 RepID=UPI0009A6A877|nr:trypsin-like peptidase domain-containing protein [Marinococcus halophilus]
MGYYDDHARKESHKQKRSRRNVGIAGFVGAIIGAGVMTVSAPFIYDSVSGENTETVDGTADLSNDSSGSNVSTEEVSADSGTVTAAADKVSGAVVGVFNQVQAQNAGVQGSQGSEGQEDGSVEQGTGSGVIYKKENGSAFIVTNNHVVEGANSVEISLADDTRLEAEIVGTDPYTDLAVLKVDGEKINTVADFGSSEDVQVGDQAIAIGNPLGTDLTRTVTEGIISAKDRSIPVDYNGDGQNDWEADVMQTDAAINPGNSGGPLVNSAGQVIGINSMKIAQSSVEGIGFSIPTSVAVPIIEDLEEDGEVERPQLGVAIQSISELSSYNWTEELGLPEDVDHGVYVTQVQPNSDAQEAGLEQNDVITQIDGEEVQGGSDLREYLYNSAEIGDTVTITYYRDGEKQTTEIELTQTASTGE